MTTTYDKLDTINDSLNDIKTAIIAKGQTPSGNITTYATAINNIPQQSAVITSLNVAPTTSAQTITAPSGVDGYSPITVSGVTSSIDANITAGNIKKDVVILGVTGSYEGSGGSSSSRVFKANFVIDTSGNVTNFGYGKTQGVLAYNATDISVDEAYKQVYIDDTTLRLVDLSSLTTVGDSGLNSAFSGCTALTSVDLSSLTTVSGGSGLNSAFSGCTALTSVDLSSLTTVGDSGLNSAFIGCTALTSVDLSSLTTVGDSGLNSAFSGCTALTSVDLSSLTTVGDSGLNIAFIGCTALTSVDLSSLTTVGDRGLMRAFSKCTGLTDIYFRALTTSSFGSYTNQFNYMMLDTGSTVTHTIHFPSNMESTISGLTSYPLFGGESGYVVLAFDLPATE